MRYCRPLLLLVTVAALLAPSARAAEVLTNDSVISMVKAGLGEELVLSKIRSSPAQYDLSTDGIIKLKSAGVTDKIIQAMMAAGSAAPAPAPAPSAAPAPTPAAPPGLPSVVAAVHGQSLFVQAPDRVLEVLPVVAEVVHSMGKHFIPFYFGPGDNYHVVRGPKAVVRLPKGKPTFYTKVNPASFLLIRLTYDANRDFRYVVSTGATYRGTLPFTFDRLPDDTFALKPSNDLAPAEYAFVAGESFYDFGVE